MTGWSVGRSVGWLVGCLLSCLVAAMVVWLGWLVPLLERGHLSSQQVLSYASNFLYNETPTDEMTNVIKACSHRRSGIPEIFTMRNAHPYCPLSSRLSLSLFSFSLSRHRPLVYHRNIFIYAAETFLLRISECFVIVVES